MGGSLFPARDPLGEGKQATSHSCLRWLIHLMDLMECQVEGGRHGVVRMRRYRRGEKEMEEGGQKEERPLVGVSRVKPKKKSKRAKGGTRRGLRREPGQPWSASMEPGVPDGGRGAHRCLTWWAVSHHKQGPGTGLARAGIKD